jgi:hypothetical protein
MLGRKPLVKSLHGLVMQSAHAQPYGALFDLLSSTTKLWLQNGMLTASGRHMRAVSEWARLHHVAKEPLHDYQETVGERPASMISHYSPMQGFHHSKPSCHRSITALLLPISAPPNRLGRRRSQRADFPHQDSSSQPPGSRWSARCSSESAVLACPAARD